MAKNKTLHKMWKRSTQVTEKEMLRYAYGKDIHTYVHTDTHPPTNTHMYPHTYTHKQTQTHILTHNRHMHTHTQTQTDIDTQTDRQTHLHCQDDPLDVFQEYWLMALYMLITYTPQMIVIQCNIMYVYVVVRMYVRMYACMYVCM